MCFSFGLQVKHYVCWRSKIWANAAQEPAIWYTTFCVGWSETATAELEPVANTCPRVRSLRTFLLPPRGACLYHRRRTIHRTWARRRRRCTTRSPSVRHPPSTVSLAVLNNRTSRPSRCRPHFRCYPAIVSINNNRRLYEIPKKYLEKPYYNYIYENKKFSNVTKIARDGVSSTKNKKFDNVNLNFIEKMR